MFFPLLESLLQKDSEQSQARVREFLGTGENPNLHFKSLFTFAAQQDTSLTQYPSAIVVCDALAKLVLDKEEEKEVILAWILNVIEFLCLIPTESVDTSVLKPIKGETKVISIYDLAEAFDQDNIQIMFETVRHILSLMDNKQYFMELMTELALGRSYRTMILTQATANTIEIMDWKNNFTPFLIYHLIKNIFFDRHREVSSDPYDENLLHAYAGHISSCEDVQFLSTCFQIVSTAKVIPNKLKPKVAARVRKYFVRDEKSETSFSERNGWVNNLMASAGLVHLSALADCHMLKSKFPL
jgi:hypothetical protein